MIDPDFGLLIFFIVGFPIVYFVIVGLIYITDTDRLISYGIEKSAKKSRIIQFNRTRYVK